MPREDWQHRWSLVEGGVRRISKLLHALPSRWKQGAFMMQLFTELDLFEGGQTEKEKRTHCAREDNVLGLRFLPITTDGFYRGQRCIAVLNIKATMLILHKNVTEMHRAHTPGVQIEVWTNFCEHIEAAETKDRWLVISQLMSDDPPHFRFGKL